MFNVILLVIFCAQCTSAQEGELIDLDNKTQCINRMVQWCNSMQYPQEVVEMTMLSVTYEDPVGFYRVFCASDSDGTNCTRNKLPWFACAPDHTLTYKGQRLNLNISSDVDDDICTTADKAFNDLFVQNLSFDNSTQKSEIQKSIEAFFEQIAAMQEQIELIQKKLNSLPFFLDGFNGNFLYQRPYEATLLVKDDEQNNTDWIANNGKQNSTDQMSVIVVN